MAWPTTSRHERGYGKQWTKTRDLVMARDLNLCQPCLAKGRPTPAKEVDHILSKRKGGTDEHSNLQAICTGCHAEKTKQESAEARGGTYRQRWATGPDGWPVV